MAGDKSFTYRVPVKSHESIIILIIQYIFEHYKQEITLEDVAKQYSYSTRHLHRIIKFHTGLTLQQLLSNIRVEMAKRIMNDSDMTIEQISEFVGFSSQCHLSKAFKRNEGKSITEFRLCKM
jgi:transcriptional regulator GlxA family with amidase domain